MPTTKEKIVITDVPKRKVKQYMEWAKSLGGKVIAVEQEPDGEFTLVIVFPS